MPTFISLVQRVESAAESTCPTAIVDNLERTIARGNQVYRWARKHGVPIGLGTDLWGPRHRSRNCASWSCGSIRLAAEILRSATAVNAELLQEKGMLGVIAEGAHADLLVIDGNPLADLGVLLDRRRT